MIASLRIHSRWRLLLAAAAVLPALAAATPAPDTDTADADASGELLAERLAQATTREGVAQHLSAFQRIADASDGTRAAGTPGHERSARYAGRLLRAAGYEVTYQRFTFSYRETLAERLTRSDGTEVPVRVMTYSPSTPADGLTAELAAVPGTGCSPDAFDPDAVDGRIALVERGECTFAEKQAAAAEAGAVAALISNDGPGALSGTLGDADAGVIPTAGVSREDGRALAEAGGTVRLRLEQRAEDRDTVNVLATTPGGDRDTVVMAGAHLDSVAEGPGINDNASGAAALLETALRLAAEDGEGGEGGEGHPNAVRFALWSAEESGLLGSEHYVAGLTGRQRENIALYLNLDMIGSPNPGWFVYDGDAAESEAPGSARIERELAGFLGSRGHATRPAELDGRSDYAPFLDAGIPVGGVFSGAEGVMTETEASLWDGRAGEAYDPCYHAACDDLDNISRTALTSNAKAIAHTIGAYAWHAPS
ncbi:M28 family peptidase [Streptomyces sp. 6N223]|uniref:M28 family peptidase n=1 Tax=Streptomyces sp. 6N223 TaxID=3457412 RepID=UPI003FD21CD5